MLKYVYYFAKEDAKVANFQTAGAYAQMRKTQQTAQQAKAESSNTSPNKGRAGKPEK